MFEFTRNRKDAEFIVVTANATGGANSDGMDLEQVEAGDIEAIAFELAIDAEAGLSDTKSAQYALQHSDDNSSFSAVDPAISTTITGAGGAGSAAKTVRFRLSPGTKRYVRIAQTADATPGTLAGNFTLSLLF